MTFPDWHAAAVRFFDTPPPRRDIGGNDALLLALNRVWRTRYHPRTAASRSKRAVDGRRITADRLQAHRLARREARDLVRRLRATHECPRCGHRYGGPHPERHVAVADQTSRV